MEKRLLNYVSIQNFEMHVISTLLNLGPLKIFGYSWYESSLVYMQVLQKDSCIDRGLDSQFHVA